MTAFCCVVGNIVVKGFFIKLSPFFNACYGYAGDAGDDTSNDYPNKNPCVLINY